jgi:predicted nucleic acid-binding protein
MRIYLDVCCLNRPFDDQTQERIRLEAEAILLILRRIQADDWSWAGSPAVIAEIRRTPDEERRQAMTSLLKRMNITIPLTTQIAARVQALETMGFKPFDAAHLAFAEAGQVDVFLTTDDRLIHTAVRHSDKIAVEVENPLRWLQERML